MLCKDSFEPHHWPPLPDHCVSDLQAIMKKKKKKKLSFCISCAAISSFFLSAVAIQGDIRENSGLSLLFALWICRWLKGKWLSLLIALFLQRNAIKWLKWKKKQEQNCNKITSLIIFLFISRACSSLQKWRQMKNVILLNGSFCLSFEFRSSMILQRAPESLDFKRILYTSLTGTSLLSPHLVLQTGSDTHYWPCTDILSRVWFCYIWCSGERMWNTRHSAIMSFQLLPSHSYAEQTCKYHICRHVGHFFHYVWCKVHRSSQQHLLFNIESLVIPRYLLEFFLYFYQAKYVLIFTEM